MNTKLRILASGLLLSSSISFATPTVFQETSPSIAATGTTLSYEVINNGLIPRGSAMITGSGDLKNTGIHHIIHIIPGSIYRSTNDTHPTLKALQLSLANGLKLAKERGIKRVALPFLASELFLESLKLSEKDLAFEILKQLEELYPEITKVITVYRAPKQLTLFKKLHQTMQLSDNIIIMDGSITDFNRHKAPAIMSTSNMEVHFTPGTSGVIANASGEPYTINNFATEQINDFNRQLNRLLELLLKESRKEENAKQLNKKLSFEEKKNEFLKIEKTSKVKILKEQRKSLEKAMKDMWRSSGYVLGIFPRLFILLNPSVETPASIDKKIVEEENRIKDLKRILNEEIQTRELNQDNIESKILERYKNKIKEITVQ